MLRKLFISLIILSALTANGNVNPAVFLSELALRDSALDSFGAGLTAGLTEGLLEAARTTGDAGLTAYHIRCSSALDGSALKDLSKGFGSQGIHSTVNKDLSYNNRYMRMILPYTAFNSAFVPTYGSDASPPLA